MCTDGLFCFCDRKGRTILEPIEYMQEALSLARLALGYTSPNPAVGCVIVKDGKIVGRGYHHKAGTPHAEVWALREAGDQAEGATVYVTLEPCAHYGRTPPCARTLVERKVGKVVMAMLDPNPLVAGKGAAILRQAGIPVEVGLLSREAAQLNEVFIKNMMVEKPFIASKLAQSLDGRIASRTGKSQWITNEEARREGHYLRSIYDGILVGINTILADNPLLTCRIQRKEQEAPHQPVRIVLDTHGRIPETALVITDKTTDTIVVTTTLCHTDKMRCLKELDEPAVTAEEFFGPNADLQLKEYINDNLYNFGGDKIYLKLKVNSGRAEVLFDYFPREDIMLLSKDEDSITVGVDAVDSEGLYFWLLQYGETVSAIGPKQVVEKMKGKLKTIAGKY